MAACIISFYANVAYVLVHACSRIADYHLNVFTLSWPQGVPVTSVLRRRSKDHCGEVPLLGLSRRRENRPFSLLPRMMSPFLSHSVGIVTLTYEDRGIRFLCGPYCLLFRLFASRTTFAARFYDTCVYLAISHTRCSNIVDFSDTK